MKKITIWCIGLFTLRTKDFGYVESIAKRGLQCFILRDFVACFDRCERARFAHLIACTLM